VLHVLVPVLCLLCLHVLPMLHLLHLLHRLHGGNLESARVCKGCVFVNCTLVFVAHRGCTLVLVAYDIFVGIHGLVVDYISSVGI